MSKLHLASVFVATAAFGIASASHDRNVIVPDSSNPHFTSLGYAHTNHLIYVGPPPVRLPDPFLPVFATHGPSVSPLFFLNPAGKHPTDIRLAYNLPSTGGTGAIAIVDAYHYATSLNDFNVFANQFGLLPETSSNATASTNKVFQVVYQTNKQPRANAGWGQEAALDIEWAHSLAPNAKIYLVEANSASLLDLTTAAAKAATLPGVREVTMSFGGGESSGETSYDSKFVRSGVVFFASSGDTGGAQEYPAESPNVVAVGGTTLNQDSSGNFLSETVWSGSGGGPSAYETIPSFQSAYNTLLNLNGHRGAPDISLDADPNTGVSVYDSTASQGYVGWMVFGGTSVASPCCAGIANVSGAVYTSTSAELTHVYGSTSNFRDIISGSSGSFNARTGYDLCTGNGSPLGTGAL